MTHKKSRKQHYLLAAPSGLGGNPPSSLLARRTGIVDWLAQSLREEGKERRAQVF
jgi:hypothetical protein